VVSPPANKPGDVGEMFKEEAKRSGVAVEKLLVEITSRALNKPPSLKPSGRRLSEALREFREEVLKIEGVVDVVIPDEEFHESNVLVLSQGLISGLWRRL
jgi:beta-galactosidase GanA